MIFFYVLISFIFMKIYFKILFVVITIIFANDYAYSRKINIKSQIKQIVESNQSKLGTINQLIVVYNNSPTDTNAIFVALEKNKKGKWKYKIKPTTVGIGKNGFALSGQKVEGDGKSPTGLFPLGQLFCYEPDVPTQLPFILTTSEDKWIDDPESDDYNKYIRGETSAKSFEKLRLRSDAYKYCMVIEYNTHPVVKGKGSAIFFHLGKGATSGCVVIDRKNMIKILKWLLPQKKTCILMGNKEVLENRL